MNKFNERKIKIDKLETQKIMFRQYYLDGNSLYNIEVNENEEAILKWLSNGVLLLKVIENEDTGNFKYLLEISTAVGKRQCLVDKRNITLKKFDSLAEKGFSFNEEYTALLIKFLILSEDDAENVLEYTYLGFRNGEFWGYPKEGREYVGNLKLECSENYDKETLNKLLKDSPELQFAVVVGASTGVLGYLGQKIPFTTNIVHFWGDTSSGKTTALLTAISVWGKPTIESGMLSTWNQTENALMSNRLANNFIAPVALDESSLCKYDLTSSIYNISQGINRQRLKKDTTPVKTAEWLTMLLSSGESPLLEHTNQNGGLKVRCFDFNLQITKSAEHANSVKAFVLQNYGTIGKEIVANLEESDFSEIEECFQEKRLDFLDLIPKSQHLPITDRLADTYAVWLLTAEFLQQLDVNIQYDKIFEIIQNHHQALEKTYDISSVVYNVLISRVASKKPLYPRKSEYFGIGNIEGFVIDGYVIFIATEFEKILRENGFDDKLLCLRSLYKAGLLKKQREDTYYSKTIVNNVSVKTVFIKNV